MKNRSEVVQRDKKNLPGVVLSNYDKNSISFFISFYWLLWRSMIAQYRDKSRAPLILYVRNFTVVGLGDPFGGQLNPWKEYNGNEIWTKFGNCTYCWVGLFESALGLVLSLQDPPIRLWVRILVITYFLDMRVNPYTDTDAFNINGAIFSAVCSFSFTYLFLVVFAFPRMQGTDYDVIKGFQWRHWIHGENDGIIYVS